MSRIRFDDLPMVIKIGVAPVLALIALALVTLAGLWSQHNQSDAIQRVANSDMAVSLNLAQISKRIAGVHGEIYVLLTQQAAQMDATGAQNRLDAIGKETDVIKADLAKVETQLPVAQRKAFGVVNGDLTDYRGAIDVVSSMLAIDFKTAQAFVAPFEAHYIRMTQTLDAAAGAIQRNAVAEAKTSAASAASVGLFTAAGSGLTLLLVSGVAVFTVLGTRRAVERIADATKSLANGDHKIDLVRLARKDELGAVVQSLSVFKDNQVRLETMRRDQSAAEAREGQTRQDAERLRAETAASQTVMVDAVADGLSRLSQGDLTFRLDRPFAAEYEQIRSDFNAAIDRLQNTLKVIARTAATIDAGAEEIASASDDLSRRTESQAARLEQTAAAVDELTSGVKTSAASALQASEMVSTAKTEAASSGAVVKQAVEAMGKIEQSSRQISQIIGVIDEIAFQTNLLALNAGVEAARAGDSGRGFAVVAQEVRALAQRSAEAAREIKGLISASSREVGAGVSLVAQTGAALERIIGKVGEIDSLIGGIATNAKAQATGIAEVNSAVNQMDSMTQQNAAMVEEATASTQNLKGEVAELSRLISAFKTGHDPAADMARRRPLQTAPSNRPPISPARAMFERVQTAFSAAAVQSRDWEEF